MLPDEMTYGESYEPAMRITDQAAADEYFRALVERNVRLTGNSDAEAERVERINVGYWAGYHDADTAMRVRHLFRAPHPIFGGHRPSTDQALAAGRAFATLSEATDSGRVGVEAFGRAFRAAQSPELVTKPVTPPDPTASESPDRA